MLLALFCAVTACAAKKAGPGSGVLQHHNHASRDGVYVDPLMTRAAAASMHFDASFGAAPYLGPVRAQPLYLDGVDGKPDLILVATMMNHVHAFSATTGVEIWDRRLGPQAIRPASVCSAGSWGIVGTPIIDGATRVLYVDAYTTLDGDGATTQHRVFALDADTGEIRPGWPADVDGNARSGVLTFSSTSQNQHGALALAGGRLFVPFGGFGGDCGEYHGWVVAISTSDPRRVDAWATPGWGAGIWAPAGISSDGSSLYFATGNAGPFAGGISPPPPPGWNGGEAIFKMPFSLAWSGKAADHFVPENWQALDGVDADLGSTSPIVVDVPGATPSALLINMGKDHRAYLLDRNNLGGIGLPLAGAEVSVNAIVTAPAAYTTAKGTYVVFRGPSTGCLTGVSGQLVSVKISATSPPTLSQPWCSLAQATTGSPAVSMADASGTDAMVWIWANDNKLYAFDGDTGAPVLAGSADLVPDIQPHQTPIIAKGRIFIAGDSRLYVFTSR